MDRKHNGAEGERWSLMIFRARATRGRRLPSLDAKPGLKTNLAIKQF